MGFAAGAFVVLASWVLDMDAQGLAISPANVLTVHLNNPLHWLVDLTPVALGVLVDMRTRIDRLERQKAGLKLQLGELAVVGPLVTGVLDAVLLVDASGRIEEVNPAAEGMFGASIDDLRGRPISALLPDHASVGPSAREFRKTGRGDVLGVEWKMTAMYRGGEAFPVRVSTTTYEIHHMVKALFVVRDVGAVEVREKELEAKVEAAAGEGAESTRRLAFLTRITGEIRASLRSIVGSASGMGSRIGGEQGDEIESIAEAGRALLGTVSTVLDLSKLDAAAMSLHLEPVPVDRISKQLTTVFEPKAEAAGLKFAVNIDPNAGVVRADAGRLHQIMNGLISTAVESASATVMLTAMPVSHEGLSCIALMVNDDGPGLSPEELEAMLSLDPMSAVSFDGVSMRFAIGRRLAERMGGELSVFSQPGRGTRVILRLPGMSGQRVLSPPETGERDTSTTVDPEVFMHDTDEIDLVPGRVLVIGDDAVFAAVVNVLGEDGVISTGFDGAFMKVQSTRLTVIVLHAHERAWPLLRGLKADPALAGTPVLVVYTDAESAERAYTHGAAEMLLAPVDPHKLRAALTRCHLPMPTPRIVVASSSVERRDKMVEDLRGVGWCAVGTQTGMRALELAATNRPRVLVVDGVDLEESIDVVVRAFRSNADQAGVGVVAIGADDSLQEVDVHVLPADAPKMMGEVRRAVTEAMG